MISRSNSSFYQILLILQITFNFLRCKDNFCFFGKFCCDTLWVEALKTFLGCVTIISMGYHTRYHSFYHALLGVLCRFQRTTIIILLLHRLLYALQHIFREINTYFFDFQRVATLYHQIFKKEVYYYLLEKTDGNAW